MAFASVEDQATFKTSNKTQDQRILLNESLNQLSESIKKHAQNSVPANTAFANASKFTSKNERDLEDMALIVTRLNRKISSEPYTNKELEVFRDATAIKAGHYITDSKRRDEATELTRTLYIEKEGEKAIRNDPKKSDAQKTKEIEILHQKAREAEKKGDSSILSGYLKSVLSEKDFNSIMDSISSSPSAVPTMVLGMSIDQQNVSTANQQSLDNMSEASESAFAATEQDPKEEDEDERKERIERNFKKLKPKKA